VKVVKSKLRLLEECIEEKTKEYHRAVAQFQNLSNGNPSSSFANARIIVATFEAQQLVDKIEQELNLLNKKRLKLLSDITEQTIIQGSREEVLKRLSELPDGSYKLMKFVERESYGKE